MAKQIDPEVVQRATKVLSEYSGETPEEMARRLYEKGLLNPHVVRSIDYERETPISALGLSVILENTLRRHGVVTAGDLETWTVDDVLDMRCVGINRLIELESALRRKNIYLKDSTLVGTAPEVEEVTE